MILPKPTRVAVIGCGYWGPNLVRVLAASALGEVRTLCDVRESAMLPLAQQYAKDASLKTHYKDVLADADIDAIVVATPAATHFDICRDGLQAGKHVLVEKPLATRATECRELIDLAERQGLTLMVGHVFLYNAAVLKAKEYIDGGELGDVIYALSQRLNLGRIQTDLNCLWSFAPHDVSILCYWLGQTPARVSTFGFSYLHKGVEDVVFARLSFPRGVGGHLHLSWLDPRKVRTMTLVGDKKMLVYDDVSTESRLQLYDKGVIPGVFRDPARSLGEFQLQTRGGDLLIPTFRFLEPLSVEVDHFLDCIRTGQRPRTDGRNGLQVVQVLEAMDKSLRLGGAPVEVDRGE